MLNAAKGGVAIPDVIIEIWNALLNRAQAERGKAGGAEASHFMILPEHEPMLKYLKMFFSVHLLMTGKSTKTDRTSRSLYCFDYGVCEDNRLGFSTEGALSVMLVRRRLERRVVLRARERALLLLGA